MQLLAAVNTEAHAAVVPFITLDMLSVLKVPVSMPQHVLTRVIAAFPVRLDTCPIICQKLRRSRFRLTPKHSLDASSLFSI